MPNDIKWDDPCEAAPVLHAAYMRLISGMQETEVQYRGNGVMRRTSYSNGHINALWSRFLEAQAECARKQGLEPPRRRFAIQAGSRRIG